MTSRTLEIRDSGTFIPVLAIQVSGEDGYLFRRAGFGRTPPLVLLINLVRMACEYDPYSWAGYGRTMTIAHAWITEHWDSIEDEAVIDVEFILGERSTPKTPERIAEPMA